MKKRIIIVLAAISILFGIYWVANHSFVEIQIENGNNESSQISMLAKNDNKEKPFTSNNKAIKRLVSKSDYEVLITNGQKSFYSVVRTSGFLRTKQVAANMKAEKAVRFMGDNPEECTSLVSSTLISFPCGGYFSDIKTHNPATSTSPTYTTKNTLTELSATIQNISGPSSDKKVVIVRKSPSGEGSYGGEYYAYNLSNNLAVARGAEIKALNKSTMYEISSVHDGIVAFSSEAGEVQILNSAYENIQTIKLDKPAIAKPTLHNLDFADGKLAALYSTWNGGESSSRPSEVVVYSNDGTNHYVLDAGYLMMRFCGKQKICLLNDNKSVDVYDISGKKPELQFSIKNVQTIESQKGRLLAIRSTNVLNVDVDNRTGYQEVGFGGFGFASTMQEPDGYTLRLTGSNSRVVAVHVNSSDDSEEGLVAKISKLQRVREVNMASIYDKYIYIIPDLGKPEYNQQTGGFEYNEAVKNRAAQSINAAIDQLQIDRKKYIIVIL